MASAIMINMMTSLDDDSNNDDNNNWHDYDNGDDKYDVRENYKKNAKY